MSRFGRYLIRSETFNIAGYQMRLLVWRVVNIKDSRDHLPRIVRDGPLENLWGEGGEVQKKNIRARQN